MEGLDDTGRWLADAAAHRGQIQTLPCAACGTDASSPGVNDTCVHQHGDSIWEADAMAHSFDSPHSGQELGHSAMDMGAATAPRRSRPV